MRLFRAIPAIVALVVFLAVPVSAQDSGEFADTPSLLGGTIKAIVLDPTTYAPAAVWYSSMLLDWKSSQPFFRNGFLEDNPRYTVNGQPHALPLSYGAGTQQILRDALAIVPSMMVNNAASHLLERTLIRRHPEHRTAFRVLGVAQRVTLSALISYRLSAVHFAQWQKNRRLAGELGYR